MIGILWIPFQKDMEW